MKRFHLYLGIAIVIVFVLTGQYMEYVHNRTLPDGPRLLHRSRHIYLLLSGLINLSIGTYLSYRAIGWRGTLQRIGSIMLTVGPVLLLVGFFREPWRGTDQTLLAPLGIYATALGTILHFASAARRRTTEGARNDD
jgi:hypothetical protein